jgi:outer membrane receptor for ferrienterochelin and colicins
LSNQYHFICSNHNKGTVTADGMPLQMANIVLKNTEKSTITTANGSYHLMVFQWET